MHHNLKSAQSLEIAKTWRVHVRFGQLIGVIALVIALYILWQIRQILMLIFAAVVLATVLNQLVQFLPAVSLVAVVIFGKFFGFLGVFLAVPLVIVLQVWLKEILVKDVLNKWRGEDKKEQEKKALAAENVQPESVIENS